MKLKDLKEIVHKTLEKKMTVQRLCKEIGIYDDFAVMHAITILEFERKVKLAGFMQAFQPTGHAVLLAEYESMK